jgi:hypothetical protein
MSVESTWRALAQVSRLRTRTHDAISGDAASIVGEVGVIADGDSLRYDERGVLTTPDGRTLETRNTILWMRERDAIAVSHERFGAANAVALVRLVVDGDGLRSESDHNCSDDRYACAVRVIDGGIEVAWTITGPRKRMAVTTVYS